MARGPLVGQAVPSPVFIQPSASPPAVNGPRINEAGKFEYSAPVYYVLNSCLHIGGCLRTISSFFRKGILPVYIL
jgi:hypothetical protein